LHFVVRIAQGAGVVAIHPIPTPVKKQKLTTKKVFVNPWLTCCNLRCGIVSTRVPRIAAQQPLNAKPPPFYYAMFQYSLTSVVRACWCKPASWGAKRTNQVLINMYQLDNYFAHLFCTRLNSVFKLWIPSSWCEACRGSTTISSPNFLMVCRLKTSRTILFIRFLSTAVETSFFLTITPSLALLLLLRTKKTLKKLSEMVFAWITCP